MCQNPTEIAKGINNICLVKNLTKKSQNNKTLVKGERV